MKDYNTGSPLGSSYNGNALYGGMNMFNPLGMFMPNSSGNFLSFLGEMAFGDSNAVNNFMNEMTGVNSQQREFEQQEYLLEKEQDFAVDYKRKMDAMKEAGINPLTAAAGLAGASSNPSAPAVANNTGGAAAGLGAGANALNAITGGAASLADAAFKNATVNPTVDKLRNEAGLVFEQLGLTAAEKEVAIANAQFADENAILDIQTKRVNVKSLAQQYKNLKATHEQILADIDLKISQVLLNGSQEEYYNQLKLRTAEETRWIKEDNDFWVAHGYDRHAKSNDAIIAQMVANNKDPEPFMSAWCNYAENYNYASAKGSFDADIDTAYSRFYNEWKAKADVDVKFKPYLEKISAMGNVMKDFARAMFENPTGHLSTIAFEFLNKMFVLMFGQQINIDDVNSAGVPAAGNADQSNHGS